MQTTERTSDVTNNGSSRRGAGDGQHLYSLLKPWGNPRSLQQAAPGIVDDLLRQQQIYEERILNRTPASSVPWSRSLIFIALLGVTVGTSLVVIFGAIDGGFLHSMRNLLYSATARLSQLTHTEKLMFASIVAWLVGTVMLWTTRKR